MARSVLRFGPYVLNPATGELRKRDRQLRLAPQAFDVLALLASRAGETVTREEFRREIWGEGTFVDFDLGLYRCLTHIRAVLGDDPRRPRYVETRPRRGYRFLAPVERAPLAAPSIAVLPFENVNHDPAFEYFADGVTDALITELGGLGGLRVIARQSVLHLKGSERNIAQIARELDVDAIVEGTALRADKCVRVTAQLIGLEPERHMWAQSYECEIRDVLGFQSEVASTVARQVCAAVGRGGSPEPAAVRTADPEVQDAYLRARHHLSRWTRDGFQHGVEYLQQAIRMNPEFAPAQAALADCFSLLGFWGYLPISEAYPKAKTSASTAVRLDPGSSDAHHSLAFILWIHDWDFQSAEREIARAIALNPNSERARLLKACYLAIMTSDRTGAQAEAVQAARIDPLGIFTNSCIAWVFFFLREYEQAIARARRTLDLYPDSLQAHYVLGLANALQGGSPEAVRMLARAVEISPDAISIGYLAYANGLAGVREAAQVRLNELLEKAVHEYVPPKSIICACLGTGDLDGAFAVLERALAMRDSLAFWIPVVPVFDGLRADARYGDFLRRLKCEFRRPERKIYRPTTSRGRL